MGLKGEAAVNNSSALIAGLDVGDKHTQVCIIDPVSGDVLEESRVRTTPTGIERLFSGRPGMRVALETGTHSPWMSRSLSSCGHEVIVANPRQVRLIHSGHRKNDRLDAEKLARLARYDVKLLAPVEHRSEQAQADLAVIRSRDVLVKARTGLISHVRGVVKAFGHRIPKCSSKAFHKRAMEHLPEALTPALMPVIGMIENLTTSINAFDKKIEELCEQRYPETQLLRQVDRVGALTALTFVLTLESPERFAKSREVGPYLGLTPREHQSGDRSIPKRISKQGDEHVRWMLVNCAQQILGPKGQDCDLRRYGQRLLARGGAYAKKKAVTAVARKLAVLLHYLWSTGVVYDPDYNLKRSTEMLAA